MQKKYAYASLFAKVETDCLKKLRGTIHLLTARALCLGWVIDSAAALLHTASSKRKKEREMERGTMREREGEKDRQASDCFECLLGAAAALALSLLRNFCSKQTKHAEFSTARQ